MAIRMQASGAITEVFPKKRKFTLDELYEHIGCETVQMIGLTDGRQMWMDENGKAKGLSINRKATMLLHEAGGIPWDYVGGTVLITKKSET